MLDPIVLVASLVLLVAGVALRKHAAPVAYALLLLGGALLVVSIFGLGLSFLFQVLFALAVVIPIVGALDAALTPDGVWQAADQSKLLWVVLQLVGAFVFGLGVLVVVAYFAVVRPKLRTHAGAIDRR